MRLAASVMPRRAVPTGRSDPKAGDQREDERIEQGQSSEDGLTLGERAEVRVHAPGLSKHATRG